MTVSVCPDCGQRLVGAVTAVLHYDRQGSRPSPCERRQQGRPR